MRHGAHLRIEAFKRLGRTRDLRLANTIASVNDLALEIGEIDGVVIDDAERAYSRRREIEKHRCPKSAGADDQHPGFQQLLLTFLPDLVENDVARVALELGIGDRH